MPDMPELSRRSFVTKASLGAAAAGALAAAGAFAGRADAAEGAAVPAPAAPVRDLPAPVVAHLTDLQSGQVSLYVGERGITVTDHTLAQHIARAISA